MPNTVIPGQLSLSESAVPPAAAAAALKPAPVEPAPAAVEDAPDHSLPVRAGDPRRAHIVEHLRALASEHPDRPVLVGDYQRYRLSYNRSLTEDAGSDSDGELRMALPADTTLYRLFGSFPAALGAAGIAPEQLHVPARISDEALIAAVRAAAADLDTEVLTSHEYDRYRRLSAVAHHYTHADLDDEGMAALAAAHARAASMPAGENLPAPGEELTREQAAELLAALPEGEAAALVRLCPATTVSSAVIRKWLGPWERAMQRAGLSTVEQTWMRCWTHDEFCEGVQLALHVSAGELDPNAYNRWHAALPDDERRRTPDAAHVLDWARSWEVALRDAEQYNEREVHPGTLWGRDEAQRALGKVAAFLAALRRRRGLPDADGRVTWHEYETIRSRSAREMPSAEVVNWLLPGRLSPASQ